MVVVVVLMFVVLVVVGVACSSSHAHAMHCCVTLCRASVVLRCVFDLSRSDRHLLFQSSKTNATVLSVSVVCVSPQSYYYVCMVA